MRLEFIVPLPVDVGLAAKPLRKEPEEFAPAAEPGHASLSRVGWPAPRAGTAARRGALSRTDHATGDRNLGTAYCGRHQRPRCAGMQHAPSTHRHGRQSLVQPGACAAPEMASEER